MDNPEQPTKKWIGKAESFVNERGFQVDVVEPYNCTEDDRPEELDRFTGSAVVGVQTPQGIAPQRIQFPIDATNVEQAFEKFEESAQAFIEAERQKAMGPRLVHPSANETAHILKP